MKETFIRKHWNEEEMTFWIHFVGDEAVHQIEVTGEDAFLTSTQFPNNGSSMLYDKKLSDLDITSIDLVSKDLFFSKWQEYGGLD